MLVALKVLVLFMALAKIAAGIAIAYGVDNLQSQSNGLVYR